MALSRISIFILLIFFSSKIKAQIIGVNSLVHKIEKYNRLDAKHTGIAGSTSIQYRNFIKLKKVRKSKLLSLLKHKNSVVKGYASWALADNKYNKLYEILFDFIESGEKVHAIHGCIGSDGYLANEFYWRICSDAFYDKESGLDSSFYSSQLKKMDSIIIFSNKKTDLLDIALGHNQANPNFYSRIKELAAVKQIPAAIEELAKYRKQEDIPYILSLGEKSFSAISFFPDEAFWEFLVTYKHSNDWDYFGAVSSYQNEKSLNLLNNIYKDWDSNSMASLDEALIKRYCILYQDLLMKIWEKQNTIDLTITKKLIEDCPEKASASFAKGLLNQHKFNFIEFDFNYGSTDSILPLMFQNVKLYNPNLIPNICKNNIHFIEWSKLGFLLTYIENNHIIETTPDLLERLNTSSMAFEIYNISKTLISFKNEEVNKYLSSKLYKNRKDWDWGNWSEAMREMLRTNNIELK